MEENSVDFKIAKASMILGIIGCSFILIGSFIPVYGFFFKFSSLVLGIIGLILAGNAKKKGVKSSERKAGFILSLISLIFGVLAVISLVIIIKAFVH